MSNMKDDKNSCWRRRQCLATDDDDDDGKERNKSRSSFCSITTCSTTIIRPRRMSKRTSLATDEKQCRHDWVNRKTDQTIGNIRSGQNKRFLVHSGFFVLLPLLLLGQIVRAIERSTSTHRLKVSVTQSNALHSLVDTCFSLKTKMGQLSL